MFQVWYLYSRMYYNKMRKSMQTWWQTYLLFKCCIIVVPIYSFLLAIGLYCIVYSIDVTSSLKTCYELVLLILSAAAIFIIVLLLATLNADSSRPIGDDEEDYYDEYEDHNLDSTGTVPSSILIDGGSVTGNSGAAITLTGLINGRSNQQQQAPPVLNRSNSGTFGFMSTLFGNYNPGSGSHHRDDDYIDDIYYDQDDDLILNEMMMVNLMMLENGGGGQLPTTSLPLSQPVSSSDYRQLMSLSSQALPPPSHLATSKLTIAPPLPPLSSSNRFSLNCAQDRLITTMERTADNLEFFFDQCDSFGDLLESDSNNNNAAPDGTLVASSSPLSSALNHQYHSPPPGYYSATVTADTPTTAIIQSDQQHSSSLASLSSIQLNGNQEKPPSYEEAIQ